MIFAALSSLALVAFLAGFAVGWWARADFDSGDVIERDADVIQPGHVPLPSLRIVPPPVPMPTFYDWQTRS